MSVTEELPFLRRYARALTGSQESGDAYVRATLEVLLERGGPNARQTLSKVELYRAFHAVWSNTADRRDYAAAPDLSKSAPDQRLLALPPSSREAMLLTYMEGFPISDVARILGCDPDDVDYQLVQAQKALEDQLATRVLIIEDESIIALDLQQTLAKLGHRVIGIAATKDAAVRLAKTESPGLVLADIRLADGSSGLDAVNEILRSFDVPVIFITAYPERLLTGERPEPTYLIAKPFMTDTVMATIGQALFFHPASPSLQ